MLTISTRPRTASKKSFLSGLALRASGIWFAGMAFAGTVFADPVTFTDANLEQAVREAFVMLSAPLGATIDSADLAIPGFDTLNASNREIASLEGLQHATHLQKLNIGYNNVSDLSPLGSLTELEELKAGHNQISDLTPLQNLTGMTYLGLGIGDPNDENEPDEAIFAGVYATNVNQITDLSPLSNLTGLKYLNVGGSKGIDSIAVLSTLTHLESFILTNTSVTDFSPLENLGEIKSLVLAGNGMQDSDLPHAGGLSSLEMLYLSNEPDLSDLTALGALNPYMTIFFDLRVSDFAFMAGFSHLQMAAFMFCDITAAPDLSGCAVHSLGFQGNPHLTDISTIGGITSLVELSITDNQLSNIAPLATLTNLEYAELNANRISDIEPLLDNPGLGGDDYVDLTGNPLSGPPPSAACTQLPEFIARFNHREYVLSNAVCGNVVNLTLSNVGLGLTMPLAGSIPYPIGQEAMLIAVPQRGTGFAFGGWSGDLNSDSTFESIVMDENKNVVANFVTPGDHTLLIDGAGPARDGFSPVPSTGSYEYLDGQTARVLGVAEDGQGFFAGWSGDVTSSNPYIEVPMDSDKNIVGNVVREGFTVRMFVEGKGKTTLSPFTLVESFQLAAGLVVSVEALPTDSDWVFDHWKGDIGANDPLNPHFTLTVDAEKEITAVFSPVHKDFALTLKEDKPRMPQNQDGFTIPPSGAYAYDDGEQVTIEAFPAPGKRFGRWDGDVPEELFYENPLTLTMDQNRLVAFTFAEEEGPTLTLDVVGDGAIEAEGGMQIGPASYIFTEDSGVILRAVCDADTALLAWSGDIEAINPTSRSIYIPMNQNRNITATFVPADWKLTLIRTGTGQLDLAPGEYGFMNGTYVNINASPAVNSGYAFQGWRGDAGTSSNYGFSFPMDANKTVEAVFITPGQCILTLGQPEGAYGGSLPSPGSYAYLFGQETCVQAFGNRDSFFAGWKGSITDPNLKVCVLMDGDKIIYPSFVNSGYALTLTASEGGWIGDCGPGTYYLAGGLAPAFLAVPSYGYAFEEWQGDVPGGANAGNPQLTVPMTQDRSLTAVFVSTMNPLTISVQGAGTTTPPPGTYRYEIGSTQTVYAFPEPGGKFIKWLGDIGDAVSWEPTLEVSMDQARSVTGVFKSYDYHLTVNISGAGNAAPSGTTSYFAGTAAGLTASPQANSGYAFNRWFGAVSSTDMETTVTMNGNREVTAEFITPGDFTLTAGAGGDAGESTINPGIGEFSFLNGQSFTLTAEPAARHFFSHWEGDIDPGSAYSPTVVVSMDQDRALTAIFGALTYRTLSVEAEGVGNTSPPPGTYEYVDGNRVVAFAFDAMGSGYLFDHWEGDIGENDPGSSALAFDIYENRTIRAVFIEGDWNLHIVVRGGGEAYPPAGGYAYRDGDTARFEAIPFAGYTFQGWSGDVGGANPLSPVIELAMTQNRDITATFEPESSVLCHLVNPEATPYVSNAGPGYYIYDSFDGVTEPITGLRFWGFTAKETSSGWPACDREPNDFEVIFYADNGQGEPGDVLYQEAFPGLDGQYTGQQFNEYDILDYAVTFAQPLEISSGWLSVRGVTDGDCWFLWNGSEADDNLCLQYNPDTAAYVIKAPDTAFCLLTARAHDYHSADTTQDRAINLTELLRVIQFFNSQGYYCQAGTEDGYGPGPGGDQNCRPHDSDYAPQDWMINLTELLRLIQFFNMGGYYACPGENTEDGFCVLPGN